MMEKGEGEDGKRNGKRREGVCRMSCGRKQEVVG